MIVGEGPSSPSTVGPHGYPGSPQSSPVVVGGGSAVAAPASHRKNPPAFFDEDSEQENDDPQEDYNDVRRSIPGEDKRVGVARAQITTIQYE